MVDHKIHSAVVWLALACALCCSALQAQESQAEPKAADDGMKAWYAFYQREAESVYRFKLGSNDQDLTLDRTPVLRWTNPLEEGSIHGVVYIWREQGRPVVVGQLFSYLNGKSGRVYCHAMHSLARSDEKLAAFRNGKSFWTPDSPGVELRDVPQAPAPAATRPLRLAQMKEISRRFAAETDEAARGKRVLRLLPTPLDRYPENAANGTDGALFSFVVGNDPEVMLLVEAVPSQTGSTWKYGLCRSTRSSCRALLDDVEVWHYESANGNPSDPGSGYLSVHGIETLPLTPPKLPVAE